MTAEERARRVHHEMMTRVLIPEVSPPAEVLIADAIRAAEADARREAEDDFRRVPFTKRLILEERERTLREVQRLVFSDDREEDGRWICECESLPGVMAYGPTQALACWKALGVALDVLVSLAASPREGIK